MAFQVECSPGSCIFLALLCLTIPADWLTAMILAAAVHELGHLVTVVILGGRIYSLKIGAMGAVMDASAMKPHRELISILAGSAASLALVLLRRVIPRTALFGLVQGLYNLLPMYPLDGGRAVRCILGMICLPGTAEKWTGRISGLTALGIAAVLLICCFRWESGIFALWIGIVFSLKTFQGKFACKEACSGVQYDHHIK